MRMSVCVHDEVAACVPTGCSWTLQNEFIWSTRLQPAAVFISCRSYHSGSDLTCSLTLTPTWAIWCNGKKKKKKTPH